MSHEDERRGRGDGQRDGDGHRESDAVVADEVQVCPVEFKADKFGNGSKTCADAMKEFINIMQTIGEVNFTRFKIDTGGGGYSEIEKFRKVFKEFIRLVGPSVTFLSLRWENKFELTVHDLCTLVLKKAPELSALYIEPCYCDDDDWTKQPPPPSWPLKPMPNLRRIKVSSSYKLSREVVKFICDVIQSARNLDYIAVNHLGYVGDDTMTMKSLAMLHQPSPQPSLRSHLDVVKLKTLKVSIQGPVELRSLIQLNKPSASVALQKLSLTVICTKPSSNRVKESQETEETKLLFNGFLLTQASTLRKLKFEFIAVTHAEDQSSEEKTSSASLSYGAPFRVPYMDDLHTLKLTRSEEMRIDLQFGNEGDTLESAFPNLKRLVYRHTEYDYLIPDGNDENLENDIKQLPHSGVTELCVSATTRNYPKFSPELFPAVTQFKVRMTACDTMSWEVYEVWHLFPALKMLHICTAFTEVDCSHLNLDKFVAGVDAERTVLFAKERVPPITIHEIERLGRKYGVTSPRNICFLKHLDQFTFEAEIWGKTRPGITDVGAYLGFGRASPNLKRVTIRGPPHMRNEISDHCRAFLHRQMGSHAVINI